MSSEDDKAKMRARRNALFKELNKDIYKHKRHKSRVKYNRSSSQKQKLITDEELLYDE